MIKHFISSFIYLSLFTLVLAQTTPEGENLADGYHGLLIVMLVCVSMGLLHFYRGIIGMIDGVENDEDFEQFMREW